MYEELTVTQIISKIEYLEELNTKYQSLFDSSSTNEKRALYREVIIKNKIEINELRLIFKRKKNIVLNKKNKKKYRIKKKKNNR